MKASLICTSYKQDLHTLHKFLDYHIHAINLSQYPCNIILVFESSESSKANSLTEFFSSSVSTGQLIILVNNISSGFPACLNYAANTSQAQYLLRVDTDDFITMNRIPTQISFMDNLDLDISSMDMQTAARQKLRYPSSLLSIYTSIALGMNPLAHPSICFRRAFFCKYCYYDESLSRCEDFDLWIRLLSLNRVRFLHIKSIACTYSLDASFQKDRENALVQIKLRLAYTSRFLLLALALLFGIFPNLIRLLHNSPVLLRLRRQL